MKKIAMMVIVLFCATISISQTAGGPDAYGYKWKNSNHSVSPPPFTWVDITTIGTQVTGLHDDNVDGPFTISGGFHYYWYDVTQFWVGSNGYITFLGDNIASPFPVSIPLTSGANNWIAPLLSDMNFDGTANPAECYYYSNSDSLIISFIEVPFWQTSTTGYPYTGSNTFQIILSRLDSSITFNYLSTDLGSMSSIDDAVGIENVTGSIGLQNYIDVLPPDSLTIKYYYPHTVTYSVVDGGILWNDNDKNGGIFIKKNGSPLVLKSHIKNLGNQTITSFTVLDSIRNSSSTLITSGSNGVSTLAPSSSATVYFNNTFTATAAGTYTFNSRLSGITGDLVAANNYLQQEIVAVDTTAALMTLEYSDGSYNGGLGWNGGNGGVAIYIEPPLYPCRVKSSRFYISANPSGIGFYAKIYDDDGANGSHGTLLDSVYVPSTSITNSSYNTVLTADTNLIIDSGGVYLLWYMGGTGINIGKDYDPPFSRRTYEVLSLGWANYRDILTEDFLMGLNVETLYPIANFTINSSSDPTIAFTDKSGKYPTSWNWDFGDGGSSSLRNPSHTYAVNGTYNVCLAISNAYGSDTICKNVSITQVAPVADFSMDTTADPLVSFYDQSSSNPLNWVWDFDDNGAYSNAKNPTYTFIGNGKHDVCMKVSNGGGADSICKTIYITNAPPAAFFSFDATSDPTVVFTDQSLNIPTSWHWDFGDNTTSTTKSPTHTYTLNGTYSACLIVSNTAGADTLCKTIVISHIPPVCDFLADTVLDPKIRFYDQSLNGPYIWYWDFGVANATSSLKNTSYTYTENGNYQVCFKVTNDGGSDSLCKTITIRKIPPIANFSFLDSLQPKISFTDISTKQPTIWYWEFGDGDTSTLRNPSHTFMANGIFNVCLTASNSGGNSKICKKVTITKIPPLADFTYYSPLDPKILFTDKSTRQPTSWHWDFDDNGATSTLQNPDHTFSVSGNHNVCLTATNPGGSDSVCKTVFISNIPPKSDFTFDATNDPEVSFTDQSTNLPTSWTWNFDDFGATSTLQNPVYTFTRNGDHNVCLTVSKTAGTNSKCKKVTVYNVPPVAKFVADTSLDPKISFTDKSTNTPLTWAWDFDDGGATSSLQNPTYTYTANGNYNVCLLVTNSGGTDTFCKVITVRKLLPIADFTANTSAEPTISFVDQTKNIPTSWLWDFDEDGATSALQNPSHKFVFNGDHNVCLTATNANGDHQFCKIINITKAIPVADFEYDTTAMPILSFTDLSVNTPTSWLWNFDDNGATSADQNPVYHFTVDGLHNVCLTATNAGGASVAYCMNILVSKTSIDEDGNNLLIVYPNPFSDKAIILLNKEMNAKDLSFKCYNMLGERIELSAEILSSRILIDGSNLRSGTYFFELVNQSGKVGNGKFVILR